jgi:hypothetical protein
VGSPGISASGISVVKLLKVAGLRKYGKRRENCAHRLKPGEVGIVHCTVLF